MGPVEEGNEGGMSAAVVVTWVVLIASAVLTVLAFTGHVPLLAALPGILVVAAVAIGLTARRGTTPGPGPDA